MILWSIVPEALVFGQAEEEQPWQQQEYLGRQVMLRPTEGGYGEIMSVVSSNPDDFLDARLQPGTRVRLS